MRMTKQEVKDEMRQSEGDPKLRQRMRRAYRDLSGNRMLNEVATADVVITNPTHYAVALRYRSDETGAPRVVAKGVDEVAQRIKQEARAHGVPIIERRALARALYRSVKTGSRTRSDSSTLWITVRRRAPRGVLLVRFVSHAWTGFRSVRSDSLFVPETAFSPCGVFTGGAVTNGNSSPSRHSRITSFANLR